MRDNFSGKRGFAGIMLVLIIVWALAAVLMLTGTLVAANRIDDTVVDIKPIVSDINKDTALVRLAKRTERLSGRIDKAAKPLTGELTKTLAAAKRIDTTAKSIDRGLATTLSRANEINGNVLLIGGTVGGINGNVSDIGSSVQAIGRNAQSISASARSISASAASINASVRGIRGSGQTILSRVVVIDGAVAAINRRAITIREIAQSLGMDLNETLKLVGSNSGRNTIGGHANSIDCSTVFQATGSNEACNR